MPENKQKVMVNHEWGALKEVIVGSPYFYIPSVFPEYMRPWLSDLAIERFTRTCGSTVKERIPEVWQEQVTQIDAAMKALEDRGVKVHQVSEPTEEDLRFLGYDEYLRLTMYPRDEIVVIGNNYIETSLQNPGRRSTRWAIRRTMSERLENSDARIVSMLEPSASGEGAFLESGDVFLMGRDILVGHSGNGSNTAGAKWLQRYLGEDYRIQQVPLSNKFLHLDCVLCTPRPGLAMVCREGFDGDLPTIFKDWDIIEVSPEDAEQRQGCNHMVVDEKTIMVPAELPHLSEALTKAGQEVIEMPFGSMIWQGGSFRCWHHPLVRESSL